MYAKKSNIRLLILLSGLVCTTPVLAQKQLSNAEVKRVLNAYKDRSSTFMTLETCGSAFDGPAYVMKQTENYSLDHMFTITEAQQQQIGAKIFNADQAGLVIQN